MAVQGRNTLKNWFSNGKKPPQSQFWDWIDSFWHKTEDEIPIANIEDLDEALQSLQDQINGVQSTITVLDVIGSDTAILSAENLYDVVVLSGSGAYKIGTTAGGSEIIAGELGASPEVLSLFLYFPVQTTIHFTGSYTAKIYKR